MGRIGQLRKNKMNDYDKAQAIYDDSLDRLADEWKDARLNVAYSRDDSINWMHDLILGEYADRIDDNEDVEQFLCDMVSDGLY